MMSKSSIELQKIEKKCDFNASSSSMSRIKQFVRQFPPFQSRIFDGDVEKINPDWLQNVSLLTPLKVSRNEMDFINFIRDKIQLFSKEPKGIGFAKSLGFEKHLKKIEMTGYATFNFFKFNLQTYVDLEQKMQMMVGEVKLLNFIGCVTKGLLLCRAMNLPHGNLSPETVFKSNKFNWVISPPLYSRVNLITRIQKQKADFKDQDKFSIKKIIDQNKSNSLAYLLPWNENRKVLKNLKRKLNNFFFFLFF